MAVRTETNYRHNALINVCDNKLKDLLRCCGNDDVRTEFMDKFDNAMKLAEKHFKTHYAYNYSSSFSFNFKGTKNPKDENIVFLKHTKHFIYDKETRELKDVICLETIKCSILSLSTKNSLNKGGKDIIRYG